MQDAEDTIPKTLPVGKRFDSAKSVVKYVRDYALGQNKQVKLTTRGGKSRILECTAPHCPFKVTAYRRMNVPQGDLPWYISTVVDEHRECTSIARPSARQLAALRTLRSAIASNPNTSASFLEDQVQFVHAMNVEGRRRTLYRVRQLIKDDLTRGELDSYRLLPDFLRKLVDHNPGTVAKCEMDELGRFVRCLFVCGAAVEAQPGMQRILGVDGAHCKHKQYGGTQLVLVGRDGNMRNVRVASALVPSEDCANYVWFFQACIEAGVDMSVPIMSDRNAGLIAAARELSLDLHYCTLHLIRNIRGHFGTRFSKDHEGMVWEAQRALEKSTYESALFKLGMVCGPAVRAYVEAIDPVKWTVHANARTTKLYGCRTTNFVESENSTSLRLDIRDKLPFAFMDRLVDFIREDLTNKRADVKGWMAENRKITPNAMLQYQRDTANMALYKADRVTHDIFLVYHVNQNPPYKCRVNVTERWCGCGYFDQYGIPCVHFAAALRHLNLLDTVFDYFDKPYHVETYCAAFGDRFFMPPLPQELEPEALLPGSIPEPRPGRAIKRRIRSTGEAGTSAKTYRRRVAESVNVE